MPSTEDFGWSRDFLCPQFHANWDDCDREYMDAEGLALQIRRFLSELRTPFRHEERWGLSRALLIPGPMVRYWTGANIASDEQRSLRLLTASLFRNMKVQVRGPAHCARRLATSPWAVDSYLADVHSFYIQSQDSITNVIQHSPDLRNMFGDNVTQLQANVNLPLSESSLKRIRSLDYAAHRFESMCKPLCRFVLLFDSIWRTAADVAVKRNGTLPAKRARMFLEQSTVEGLLQLALLADASLQCMDVIRFYDSEAWHHRVAGFDCRNVFCFLGLAIPKFPTYQKTRSRRILNHWDTASSYHIRLVGGDCRGLQLRCFCSTLTPRPWYLYQHHD